MNRKFTHKGLDQIAQNELKKFDVSLVSGEPGEIPIETLAEQHFGLHVLFENLTKEKNIHGMTAFEDSSVLIYNRRKKEYQSVPVERGTVLIEADLLSKGRENRLRFTIAHEVAHWILHQEVYTNNDGIACQTAVQSTLKEEREADYLAAALLMPFGRVKLAKSRCGETMVHKALIHQLANLFKVSPEAMALRLRDLNLQGKRDEDEARPDKGNPDTTEKPLLCPLCDFRVLSVHSGQKPFDPESNYIELAVTCPRCKNEVRLVLENSY